MGVFGAPISRNRIPTYDQYFEDFGRRRSDYLRPPHWNHVAGLAANSAFGSFGHSLAPGSMNGSSVGSSHFGSHNNNGVRKASSRAAIPAQWSTQDPASLNPPAGASPPKGVGGPLQNYQQLEGTGGDDDVMVLD